MNEVDYKKLVKVIQGKRRELKGSKVLARAFLVRTGIYNEDGTLTRPYRQHES